MQIVDTSSWRFGPLERPVALPVDARFVRTLFELTNGWTIEPWSGPSSAPVITLRRDDEGYVVTSDWLDKPLRYADDTDATCTFFVELVVAYSESRSDLLLLHAGAAAVAEALIVFPATGNAGKSTLTTTLAAAGACVFSDDALPVSLERGTGSALGIAPRPRVPLPAGFDRSTREFLEERIAIANESFAYVALSPANAAGGLAERGTERPIGAFILLDRQGGSDEGAPVRIVPASRAETMATLIGQHLGRPPPARALVESVAKLVERVPCLRMHYREADEAARFLVAHPPFADGGRGR